MTLKETLRSVLGWERENWLQSVLRRFLHVLMSLVSMKASFVTRLAYICRDIFHKKSYYSLILTFFLFEYILRTVFTIIHTKLHRLAEKLSGNYIATWVLYAVIFRWILVKTFSTISVIFLNEPKKCYIHLQVERHKSAGRFQRLIFGLSILYSVDSGNVNLIRLLEIGWNRRSCLLSIWSAPCIELLCLV